MGVQGLKQYIFTMGYIRIDKGRKDTRILWRVSYRENGKVKKKEYLLSSKGKITYKLPMWYIFVGIIDRKEFESELVKYWLKVAMIEDYVNWEWEGQKLRFTSKSPHYDLRSKTFKELLDFARKNIKVWFKLLGHFEQQLKELVYEPIDRLWEDIRTVESQEKEPLSYVKIADYLDYFLYCVEVTGAKFDYNPCQFNCFCYLLFCYLYTITECANTHEMDNFLKNEEWIERDNLSSKNRETLVHNKEVILRHIESINKKYAPEKRQDSLILFRDKLLENHSLPIF